KGLESALAHLTLPVEVHGSKSISEADRTNPICFEVPSAYEITSGGRKILGSAQVRRRNTVLQHGSLPLTGNIAQICDVLPFPDEAQREIARSQLVVRAATLEDIIGRPIAWSQAAEAFIQGFQSALNFSFHAASLTPAEVADGERLLHEQYLNPGWTGRIMKPTPKEAAS
ncbi:MAG: hypothetical protein MUP44_04355, partial [Anaerolineales bacterium]|nr:hypothetical protein [Anaerolineales bacterium]